MLCLLNRRIGEIKVSTKLRESYKITFDMIDFKGRLTINGISSLMQIIAGNHAEALDVNYFKANSEVAYYWILSKVKYKMQQYPKWNEEISLETYPGGYDKLYAVRLFDIYNSENEKIGHIIGDYLLMDGTRNRPVRIKGSEGKLGVLNFPYEGEKLEKLIPSGKLIREEIRKAYYYEIDLNGHMNNSHYIRWTVDMLPLELLKDHPIKTLEINYNASITYDTKVRLKLLQKTLETYDVVGESLEEEQFFVASITLQK